VRRDEDLYRGSHAAGPGRPVWQQNSGCRKPDIMKHLAPIPGALSRSASSVAAVSPQARSRTGGQILVEQLRLQGVESIFGVPGESFLAVLDALHDQCGRMRFVICRQEGGAAMMADAWAKTTGKPGICMVTRGPGATNASAGVHVAFQDSTP